MSTAELDKLSENLNHDTASRTANRGLEPEVGATYDTDALNFGANLLRPDDSESGSTKAWSLDQTKAMTRTTSLISPTVSLTPSAAPRSTFRNLKRRQMRFNIIFAGHTGTGKTTTMHNLFKDWDRIHDETDNIHVRSSKPGIKTEGIFEFAKYKLDDNTAFSRLIVHVYDSRGYGDVDVSASSEKTSRSGEDSFWDPIEELLQFVGSKMDARYGNEQLANPNEDERDPILHCCIYFLQPHRVHDADMVFMKKLSQHVPIVCVIAKADTLNDEELSNQRQEIVKQLARRRINTYSIDLDDRGSEYVTVEKPQDAEDTEYVPRGSRGRLKGQPFAIVSRDSTYPWGVLTSDDRDHSDFAYLRDALIYDHAVTLMHLSEEKYRKHRAMRKQKELHKSIFAKCTRLIVRLTELSAVALAGGIIVRGMIKDKNNTKNSPATQKKKFFRDVGI